MIFIHSWGNIFRVTYYEHEHEPRPLIEKWPWGTCTDVYFIAHACQTLIILSSNKLTLSLWNTFSTPGTTSSCGIIFLDQLYMFSKNEKKMKLNLKYFFFISNFYVWTVELKGFKVFFSIILLYRCMTFKPQLNGFSGFSQRAFTGIQIDSRRLLRNSDPGIYM